jgi:hypothetical protein
MSSFSVLVGKDYKCCIVVKIMELEGWAAMEDISLSLSFPCFRDNIIFTTSALELVCARPPLLAL